MFKPGGPGRYGGPIRHIGLREEIFCTKTVAESENRFGGFRFRSRPGKGRVEWIKAGTGLATRERSESIMCNLLRIVAFSKT